MVNRYLLALAIAAAAIALRFLVNAGPDSSAFAILLAGMLAAAWVGGVGPCLVIQTIILLVHRHYFTDNVDEVWPPTLRSIINMSAYYGVGLTVAVLSDFVRAARRRDRMSAADAMAQRERLHAVLSCMADGVIVTDEAGNIVLVNPMAESLLDLPAREAAGRPLAEVFSLAEVESRSLVSDPARRAAREGGKIHSKAPLLLRTRDGRATPVSFSAAPIPDPADGLSGVVIVFRDETERRDTEAALRAADQRKDEFLATLAHELRNPLAPICMGLELMKLSPSEGVDQAETRALVERQARHLARLVDDLLDVSRITRGKLSLRRSPVNLQASVNHVVTALQGALREAGHELTVHLPPQTVTIEVDPDRWMQILSNLLHNAIKYTPGGGRLSIDAAIEYHELRLTVSDNGRGVEADRLQTIFEMFNQSTVARESGHSGLGIGLTLTRCLVEMHGGSIEVKSEGPGRGSAFSIRLPLADSAEELPAEAEGPRLTAVAAPGRVLLVDDNRDALATLSKLVAALGHDVRTAGDGLAALEAAESFRPNAILMDLGMPQMNGYDAAREIRRQAWAQNVRLIAVTGWGQDTDRRRTEAAGFDSHLVKPVDLTALTAALADVGERAAADAAPDGRREGRRAEAAAGNPTARVAAGFKGVGMDSQAVE